MDGMLVLRLIEQLGGGLLVLLVLSDVFLTVLYARVGTGILSHHLACYTWRVFRGIGVRSTQWRNLLLSFCGPIILVLVIGMWMALLIVGAAMVLQPHLGSGITS